MFTAPRMIRLTIWSSTFLRGIYSWDPKKAINGPKRRIKNTFVLVNSNNNVVDSTALLLLLTIYLDRTKHGLSLVLCSLPWVMGSAALQCPRKGLNRDPLPGAVYFLCSPAQCAGRERAKVCQLPIHLCMRVNCSQGQLLFPSPVYCDMQGWQLLKQSRVSP